MSCRPSFQRDARERAVSEGKRPEQRNLGLPRSRGEPGHPPGSRMAQRGRPVARIEKNPEDPPRKLDGMPVGLDRRCDVGNISSRRRTRPRKQESRAA